MDTRIDFLKWLGPDMAFTILILLDDPADLVRASCVSRFWRHFVISNGLSKQLCAKRFPQLSSTEYITKRQPGSVGVGSSDSVEREILELEHNVHASLLHFLKVSVSLPVDCTSKATSASSTDRYPHESIINTLNPGDRYLSRASYWSSKGQRDPSVPETLIYKLGANLCVVTEIKIQPFKAYFQPANPIYSAKHVRFRMGHPKSPGELEGILPNLPADDKFIWTYTSQHFPMAQENCLQGFKLPEPVLCIGGFLQIELLGRVQRQETDGLFYICLAHVKVLGQPLKPGFDIDILEPSGKFLLKYEPENLHRAVQSISRCNGGENARGFSQEPLWARVELLEYVMAGDQPEVNHLFWDEDDIDALLDL